MQAVTKSINDISVCKEKGTFIINKNIHNGHSASHEQLHRHTQQTCTQHHKHSHRIELHLV